MKKIDIEKIKILSNGGKIYTARSGYSGGWKHAKDDTAEYTALLDAAGIKYKIGNDAPRGGLNGKYIYCRKFDAAKAAAKVERASIANEAAREARREIEAKYEEDLAFLYKAVFGTEEIEMSQSGNIYGWMQKPRPIDVERGTIAEGLRRITAAGELQEYRGGEWRKL